ncbi:uncharacterized protein K460DRAFT_404273 [Cucurbitaria berberidis CBS 394.84]|uniref:Uncharacterized protein n=1 Tax=Cucurbitaria berberidis CBS 394.84 TaxID=1168544 RepID=A0A9P4LC54_9PLEO|nr:uncharacterized protein K460DRAFT_404273 [Cucurbitaria berberidis CBS 394.84]KAF1849022.1 hypothetical protein K460DRAFT_404273 [Cucurbitaria berberidis CBS 394.84]
MRIKRKRDLEDVCKLYDSDSAYGSQPKRTKARSTSPDDSPSSPVTSVEHDTDFVVSEDTSEDELTLKPKNQRQPVTHPRTSRTLRSCTRRQRRSPSHDEDSDYHSANKTPGRTHKIANRSSRAPTRKARLDAELANLADYNKSPVLRSRTRRTCENINKVVDVSDSEGEYTRRACREKPKAPTLSDRLRVQGARITKPRAKIPSPKKRRHKLLAEVKQLQPWHGWSLEEEESSSDSGSESDDRPFPRSHNRHYPPKVLGSQNTPWTDIPGEIRNKIYEYAMLNEEEKTFNVIHYPNGVPRRSVRGITSMTNFAHSYWGFTQSCQQIRNEFTPWLLNKRRVRTPLATLNHYVETFHRLDQDGKRAGWIEPIFRGAPLPGRGVEVLNLLKVKHANPDLHLQLTPTTVNVILDYLTPPTDEHHFDELKIVKDMDETFADWTGNTRQTAGIEGIHITSIGREDQTEHSDGEDDDVSHEILIKLDIGTVHELQPQLQGVNSFIFASRIAQKTGVKLQASFGGGVARWIVRRPGTVDMQWKKGKGRGASMFRRLTLAPQELEGFLEESLD